uniref:Uncharacterized protein n=1 Tax=Arundo donax TaxID=35708 RepID=A0A0A9D4S3_ARUDO
MLLHSLIPFLLRKKIQFICAISFYLSTLILHSSQDDLLY